jgi:hypothetical protein
VWTQEKWEVAKKNKITTMAEVERLMNEELDRVAQEDWASGVRQAENLEEENFEKEIGWYEILEPIVINVQFRL